MFSQFLFLAKLSSFCEIYQWTEIRSAFMRYTFSKLCKEQIKVMMVASFVVLSRRAPREMHWSHLTCARTLPGSSLSDSYLQVIAICKFGDLEVKLSSLPWVHHCVLCNESCWSYSWLLELLVKLIWFVQVESLSFSLLQLNLIPAFMNKVI